MISYCDITQIFFYPFLTLSADLSTASQSKLMTEAIVKESNLAARQFISLMTQLAKRNLKGLTSRRAMYKKGDVKCVPYISKYTYFSIIAFFLSNRDALFNKKALQKRYSTIKLPPANYLRINRITQEITKALRIHTNHIRELIRL